MARIAHHGTASETRCVQGYESLNVSRTVPPDGSAVIAVLRTTGFVAQSDVSQFDPTLKPDSHLIAGSAIVGSIGLEGEFALIVRVASPTFDERSVVRTVHAYMMLLQPLGFDTVQSVNNFRLSPQLS